MEKSFFIPERNKDMRLSVFPSQGETVSQDVLYGKLKQNLLIEQISIENQDDFCNYLEAKRKNGTDIAVWTYEELVIIVDQFRQCRNLKTCYTSEILKQAVEKDGWFNSETYYYIETKEMGTDGLLKDKWEVKRTEQQF